MKRKEEIVQMAEILQSGELARNKGELDCSEFTTDEVFRVGMQRIAGAAALYEAGYKSGNTFTAETILNMIPREPTGPRKIWTNGEEILCANEEVLNAIADFMDVILGTEVTTGYYDPKEDEKAGMIDHNTGFYYISF